MKKEPSGIYEIRCILNDKKYIGSASYIYSRMSTHRLDLRKNKHKNPHLQNAWNKYGEESFTFTILEKCPKHALYEREEFWMKVFNTLTNEGGYNIHLPGSMPADVANGNRKKTPKPRVPFTAYKEIVRIGPNSVEGGWNSKRLKDGGVSMKAVTKVLGYWKHFPNGGKDKSYKGEVFVYREDYKKGFDYLGYKKPYNRTAPKIKRPKKAPVPYEDRNIKRVPIILTNKETEEEILCSSIKAACDDYSLLVAKVYNCLKGDFKQRSHHGYWIRYSE